VIASDMSFEDFLTQFDGQHVEWVQGMVIAMSPVSEEHTDLNRFLIILFDCFLAMTSGGRVLFEPMIMRASPDLPARSPDVAVVLPDNYGIILPKLLSGPADLVVEIVSPDSHRRDRVEKFAEYEKGGVPEYWILDRDRQEALFYGLNDQGIYEPLMLDADGLFHSRVLKKLRIPIGIFWQVPLPNTPAITKLVGAMLS
jgi:Uma2 family endonuclease